MNNARRTVLNNAVSLLRRASDLISTACDQEQDCLDNIPENLQYSDMCDKMSNSIDCLDDASVCVDEALDKIGEAIDKILEARGRI